MENNTKTYTLEQLDGKIKTVGRSVKTGTSLTADWSGCGIEFNVTCRGDVKVGVNILHAQESSYEPGCYFTVYVDGERQPQRLLALGGKNVLTLAKNLEYGKHSFEVYRQATNSHCNVNFDSITLDGTVENRPANRELYIEFIGDSIVCGWGVVTDTPPELKDLPDFEGYPNFELFPYSDATQAFAFLTAKNLNADYSLVARCSWGILTESPEHNIPDTYKYVCYSRNREELYDFFRKPDVVVVNIGTNDYCRFEKEALTPAGIEFVKDIRSKNGENVPIVFVWDMMNDSCIEALTAIVENSGGEKNGIYLLRLPRGVSGGGLHPDATEHKNAANILTDFLRMRVLCI